MSINEALLPCPFCGSAGNAEDGFAPVESIVYAYCSNPHCLLHDIDIGFSPHEWNARSQAPAPALPKLPITAIRFAVDLLESTLDDPTIADCTRKVFRRHHKALRALLPPPPQAEEKV